jgi:hypothetical protein
MYIESLFYIMKLLQDCYKLVKFLLNYLCVNLVILRYTYVKYTITSNLMDEPLVIPQYKVLAECPLIIMATIRQKLYVLHRY